VLQEIFEEHARVLAEARKRLLPDLQAAAEMAERCLATGNKLLVFGNGGSAADAQHFAAELVGRFERDRRSLPAVALTVDTSLLTAVGNDHGFEQIFSRQVEALGRPGDLLVAISTSGSSANVVRAVDKGRDLGCRVIGFTGEGGGQMADRVDVLIAAPSRTVARIQEIHELCLHALAAWLERRLCPEDDRGRGQ
jgi:D-sedoheptulose 7-phosphate isomerase